MNPEQFDQWLRDNFIAGGGNRVEHPEIFPASDRALMITPEILASFRGFDLTRWLR